MTSEYADLEIGLHRWDATSYTLDLRLSQPGSDTDVRLLRNGNALVKLDLERLSALSHDTAGYGRLLAEGLFGEASVQSAFAEARAAAQAQDVPLRIRFVVGPSAPELHSLRWETLRSLDDDAALLTGEHVLFSRYLSSSDWRPVRLRPKGDLRALLVIANPSNLDEYSLAPVDGAGEQSRAIAALGNISTTVLASNGRATLEVLIEQLRDGYDILYLVAHGALIKDEPWVWLENAAGQVAITAGGELVQRIRELQQRPRLLVLASCQSAGTGGQGRGADGAPLAALGPRLAEAGIPAVIAMQGQISMATVAAFMPTFFAELQRDGQIDRAIAVARGAVRARADWWMPVLFMRLKSGRIWYVPGFADDRQGFEKWPTLVRGIRSGRCTPILGPGITETILGASRDQARRWAEQYNFPMAPHDRDDLPQVAQFLAVNQDPNFPRDELIEYVRQELLSSRTADLPADAENLELVELITAVGARLRARDEADSHRVLASLPFPVYITTNKDDLLADALREAGKDPQVEICRWNEDVEMLPSIYDSDPNYRPDPQRPLIYHLFGRLEEPYSLVLTEDDYFDYLIGVTSNKDLIPTVVRRALADTALLFLGFQMDDWAFRVLYRSIMSQEGGGRRKKYAHVAAQIDPDESRAVSADGARRYLESYFKDADISIYWGSADDFVKELLRR